MARFHESNSFVALVMWNLRCLMEHGSDAVACVTTHYRVAQWFDVAGYDVAALLVHVSWLAVRDGLHEAVVSSLNERARRLTHLTYAICFIHVRMIPILVHTHIQIHYIAFFERARVGYSMTNALIDRSATASRELVVVQRRRVGIV